MVHYEPVKVTIDAPGLAEVILDVVVRHHGLPDSIVSDRGSLFTSKFWSSLCYFLGIKRRLSTAFHPQTDGQTERQNSTMEAYLRAFVNFEQNDWARLLPMAEFTYNNAKNASSGHTPFELNCGYHPRMSYEKDVKPRSKSKENLHHAQKLQKRAHNKGVKPRSYAPSDKVWLNSKYIKTKRNRKLEAKFFGPFRVLHPVGRQAYKLELPRKSFSTYHRWSRTPPERGGWMKTQRNWTPAMRTESTKWRQFGIAQSIRKSQNQVICQGSIIWFFGTVVQKMKIPGSLYWLFSTLGSSSAHSSWQTDSDFWGHRHCTTNSQANHQANGQINGSKTKARSTNNQ